MTTSTAAALTAYHGDPALKARTLAQIRAHQEADQIIQGTYWAGRWNGERAMSAGGIEVKTERDTAIGLFPNTRKEQSE